MAGLVRDDLCVGQATWKFDPKQTRRRDKLLWRQGYGTGGGMDGQVFPLGLDKKRGLKHKRVTCPLCGRRMWSAFVVDGDGDLYHALPQHKPKRWWKQRKVA